MTETLGIPVSSNAYLSENDMQTNAWLIYKYLSTQGWTMNAVAGMLGNMETESTINPGIWENLDEGNVNGGFGLVQWTPATKFIEWANERGLSITGLYGQLDRIIYECENGLQWIKTDTYPLTFKEFKKSTLEPYYLAGAFLHNYERPAEPDAVTRGNQAVKWWNYINNGVSGEGGQGGEIIPPSTTKRKNLSIIFKYIASKKKV